MNKYNILLLFLFLYVNSIMAQVIGFENEIPKNIYVSSHDKLSLSSLYYKEGCRSLEWNFHSQSMLYINLGEKISLTEETEKKYGIQLWIYNTKESADSLRFEFLSADGLPAYYFTFHLASKGWRACWISFHHMKGNKKQKDIFSCRIIAPHYRGRIFFDRMTLPTRNFNLRTTPDMQMPENNSFASRELWHWCRTWEWEQYKYDLPLTELNVKDIEELEKIEKRLSRLLKKDEFPKEVVAQAYALLDKANIRDLKECVVGPPLVAPDDNLDSIQGDFSLNNLDTMLSGLAYDAFYNNSPQACSRYLSVWKYAIEQGFSYGSGMGTNHHYGYQVENIYTSAWLMRDVIWESEYRDDILGALQYWSALQETRQPLETCRDELLDSWHTLLMPKIVSSLMFLDEKERIRALKGLSRWLSSSLQYSTGTVGGLKIDGTTFHHGGFYPAYTTGVFESIGKFLYLMRGTKYMLTKEARQHLKFALQTIRNYCNKYEWGIGISGRHPFGAYKMEKGDVEAFAYLALSGDLSGLNQDFDYSLAADYLRLCPDTTPEVQLFKNKGVCLASAPEGFFVYNYGSTGIFRRKNWMVTLKGYTTDVWGAEIYAHDNRYGRYQSYGSIQIMGYPSNIESGYVENGWDWNRLPGTTTIHLPLDLLQAPLGTMMVRSKENFSGCSSLGKDGMFAMKLMERDFENFTKDFRARKSAFCFGNRIICLGTGISNSNCHYVTETTLFQSAFHPETDTICVNDEIVNKTNYYVELKAEKEPVLLKDSYENFYYVKGGSVKVQIAEQKSHQNKTCALTSGTFASAWIDHGVSPQNASYEYLICIQPTLEEQKLYQSGEIYRVLKCDSTAHIVHDNLNHITAFAMFESCHIENDILFSYLPEETMVMYKKEGNVACVSVCCPDLNIKEKSFTTCCSSRIIKKKLKLHGRWRTTKLNPRVHIERQQNYTLLVVDCQHGQPVEFMLMEE